MFSSSSVSLSLLFQHSYSPLRFFSSFYFHYYQCCEKKDLQQCSIRELLTTIDISRCYSSIRYNRQTDKRDDGEIGSNDYIHLLNRKGFIDYPSLRGVYVLL
jgi:hypothetical protein